MLIIAQIAEALVMYATATNSISAIGAVLIVLTMATAPAHAFMSSRVVVPAASPVIAKGDFVQGHEVMAAVPARQFALAEGSKAMAERYFDADVFVTLGALAIASGAFVAAGLAGGRRREQRNLKPVLRIGWPEDVMQAVEADLMQFCSGLQKAA